METLGELRLVINQQSNRERTPVRILAKSKFSASEWLQLPVPERLQLVEDIWNSIADAPESLDVTEEDKRLIDERLEARQRDPAAGSTSQTVYDRITSRPKRTWRKGFSGARIGGTV